jgi:hypothetical protein
MNTPMAELNLLNLKIETEIPTYYASYADSVEPLEPVEPAQPLEPVEPVEPAHRWVRVSGRMCRVAFEPGVEMLFILHCLYQ